jgi:hypothetical protein
MPRQPQSIPMQSLPSATSSKWSLDTDDLERAINPLLPTPPSHAWFHPKRFKPSTRRSYLIGDPIIHPISETAYTFEDWRGSATTDVAGRTMRWATFRRYPALFPPYEDIPLPLYHTQERPRTQRRKRKGEYILGCIGSLCIPWSWLCMSRRHALRGG